jgi:CRP-like cAMP-binding protein
MASETNDLIASLAVRSLFIGLTDRQLRLLTEAGKIEQFEAGQLVISAGQPEQALYTVLSGSVCVAADALQSGRPAKPVVLSGERTAGTPCDGDFFGETSVLDFEPIRATVTAREPCDLLVIPVARLYEVFQQDRDIHIILISNLARTLSRRLQLASERSDEAGPCHCGDPEACGSRLT